MKRFWHYIQRLFGYDADNDYLDDAEDEPVMRYIKASERLDI